MKTYYVYELYNSMGTVEYVGETTRPEGRFRQHTIWKSGRNGCGKFHGRQDISMNIVAEFQDRKEARTLEGKLKLEYGLDWTEKKWYSAGGKISGKKAGKLRRKLTFDIAEEIRSRYVTENITQYCLGIEYGVSINAISWIVNHKTYIEP